MMRNLKELGIRLISWVLINVIYLFIWVAVNIPSSKKHECCKTHGAAL